MRALLPALALVLALSGCFRRDEKEAEAPPPAAAPAAPTTPAAAAAPLEYLSETPYARVKLELPQALRTHPDLHAPLYAEATADLRRFSEGAQADRTEAGGADALPLYEKTLALTPAAETGKLLSLQQVAREYTGGAHSNARFASVLWDKALKRRITAAELFRTGADTAALDAALCEAINTARRSRSTNPRPLGLADGGCPRALGLPFILATGTVGGKAGGLTFLIDPYRVDAYAAGPYRITVPQSLFRTLLAPAYADEFAGEPVKAGDADA
jgi:hypothetical protein